MLVTSLKTKAMCISNVKSYTTGVFFHNNQGVRIGEEKGLKLLGFHLSNRTIMQALVDNVCKKVRARLRVLHHLWHNGFLRPDLLPVYQTMILAIHDFCSNIYHSSLTQTQDETLERLQTRALKSIYGYEHSYCSLLQGTGLVRLSERRLARSDAFVNRCLQGRFRDWFPMALVTRATRSGVRYREDFAQCTRLQKSLLFFMRRRCLESLDEREPEPDY